MRILMVVHYFLPRHLAGTELYTFRLARELQKEHEVALFFSELDATAPSYTVRTGTYQGLPFTEVVNNHTYWRFRETYANPRLEPLFTTVLDAYRPDVVHIQHLYNLSLGFLSLLRRRRIPVVYTLHDYWLTCPRDGLRVKQSGELCWRVVPSECASCMATEIWRASPLRPVQRRIDAWRTQKPSRQPALTAFLSTTAMQEQTWEIWGNARTVYASPPPCRFCLYPRINHRHLGVEEARVRFSFALHPAAYTVRNDGAVFQVLANGQQVFSRYLCPSRREQDRGWIDGEITLRMQKRLVIEFATTPGPGGDPAHCVAGWSNITVEAPFIEETSIPDSSWREYLKNGAERLLLSLNHKYAFGQIRRRLTAVQEALKTVDVFIAPSRFLRDRFCEFGVPPEKIRYLDNGFDLTPFQVIPRQGQRQARVRFAYIGTLVEHKGVHVLVEAFNRLDPTCAELRLYGDPDVFPQYTARLQALATHPYISFAGRFENHDVGRILAEVDALVVPSIWFENSPLTIHEARLAGVPVIASNLGGMAEYVEDGKTGLLFRAGDVDDLHEKLEWFIHNPHAFRALPQPTYVSIADHARELLAIYIDLQQQYRQSVVNTGGRLPGDPPSSPPSHFR
jgi:glycosyltransferase involved in cell wall biosynthesis